MLVLALPADAVADSTVRVSADSFGGQANASSGGEAMSADGRYVAFFSTTTSLATCVSGAGDAYRRESRAQFVQLAGAAWCRAFAGG